ncbi:MAG: LysR family transcriptional regulator [Peptococcaceae bacterium]|nr:LysR family transcriptional regulator [Peptococcaceae bacterium]
MRVEQFEYLLEISKNKSMNAASKKLHITPQALSTSIKKLENELAITILERTSMGVNLTEKGQALLLLAENFLSGLKELQDTAISSAAPIGETMHLSVPRGFTETYLPELLKTIYEDYPEMEISITPCCYTEILKAVTNSSTDYGLTYKIYINDVDIIKDIPDDITFTPLYRTKFFCMIPYSFPISRYKSISLKTILDYPIIMYEPANYLMTKILEFAGKPSRLINVPSLEILNELLSENLGLTFGMYNFNNESFAVRYQNNIHQVSFKENITAEFGYIIKNGYEISAASQLQINYLKQFFSK